MSKVGLMLSSVTLALVCSPIFAADAPTAPAASTPPAAQAPAAAPASPADKAAPASSDIPKDTWLNQMLPMLPDLICKGFLADASLKKRFDDLKITYEQCAASIPAISTKCKDEVYSKMPATINNETAATWGRTIGECIGRNYAEQYLIPKK